MDTPSIWKSRKFWLMMVDTIVSLVTFFGTIYLKPDVLVQVTALIGILQVPVLFVIDSYTKQNIEAIKQLSTSPKTYITNNNIPDTVMSDLICKKESPVSK